MKLIQKADESKVELTRGVFAQIRTWSPTHLVKNCDCLGYVYKVHEHDDECGIIKSPRDEYRLVPLNYAPPSVTKYQPLGPQLAWLNHPSKYLRCHLPLPAIRPPSAKTRIGMRGVWIWAELSMRPKLFLSAV